jgi:hypothetical protein
MTTTRSACRIRLLYLKDAVDLGVVQVSSGWLLQEPRDMSEVFRKWHEMRLEQRAGLDVSWRSLLLLLTALQPRYYPVVRGTLTKITTTITFDRDTGREVDPYLKAVETFDPEKTIRRCGVSLDDLPKLYAAPPRRPARRFRRCSPSTADTACATSSAARMAGEGTAQSGSCQFVTVARSGLRALPGWCPRCESNARPTA